MIVLESGLHTLQVHQSKLREVCIQLFLIPGQPSVIQSELLRTFATGPSLTNENAFNFHLYLSFLES